MKAATLLADKAFDADQRVIKPLETNGKACVIPPNRSQELAPFRQRNLQGAPSHRLLLQPQAIPRHRNSLRENLAKLPCRNPHRRNHRLAQLMMDPRRSNNVIFGRECLSVLILIWLQIARW
jgi:hypothetical protein